MKDSNNTEVTLKNIPEELIEFDQWVAWKAIHTENKIKKIPINPKTGQTAKVNDPDTWTSFEDAVN